LLCQECVSQIRRPLDIAGHTLHYVWKLDQCLYAWVPLLLRHCVRQRFALQILVPIHPLLKLDNFKWISGSGERLSEERVRIQRNRRNQRVQLFRWKLSCLLIVRCGCHLLRLRLLRECSGAQCEAEDGDNAMN
jgi:hypothetical protein